MRLLVLTAQHMNENSILTHFQSSVLLSLQFQGNLMERLELLAQLHWALPHRLTAAEEELRDADLPQLAAECSALQSQVKVLLVTPFWHFVQPAHLLMSLSDAVTAVNTSISSSS